FAPNQIYGRSAELDVSRRDSGQFLPWIHSGPRFLAGQDECRFVRGAFARESAFGHGEEWRVVVDLISRREIVDNVLRARRHLRAIAPCCDIARLAEESRLLVEIATLLGRQEEIDRIGVSLRIMTREAIHVDTEENAAEIHGRFVDPI